VVSPANTLNKDIIKTKGGRNSCILVDTIDIKALRDFQILDCALQKDSQLFKQTPPGFNKFILEKKREGILFSHIQEGL